MKEKDIEKVIEVQSIVSGSIAEEAGIEAGDRILTINGQKIYDVFDYRFLIADEELMLEVLKTDGEIWEIEIEKEQYEDIGIEFENSMLDDAKSCTNKCIFCFIDQLPKGMRDTLYFKDDDSRLSFLMGNYVTLTNMKDSDIDRIIRYRMSPINVSVHTTNPELRVTMLNNKFAGEVVAKIKRLVEADITVNCQIVSCRGINDGEELDRSLAELGKLYPGINSISIVPVGITKYRDELFELKPYDKDSAEQLIIQVEKCQREFLNKYGSRVVYIADEFYIMAERNIPEFEDYEDFPQIENGIGLVALLRHEVYSFLEDSDIGLLEYKPRKISIATGTSVYKYIKELAQAVECKFTNIKVNVFEIKNKYFGENVTVTGLLTGSDIVSQLSGEDLGQELLISKSMLRAGENILLDDYTTDMIESQLHVKISSVENNGKDLVEKILGIDI